MVEADLAVEEGVVEEGVVVEGLAVEDSVVGGLAVFLKVG